MTHTQNPPGNQSERDTPCVDSLISDKPNSKALFYCASMLCCSDVSCKVRQS